MQSRYKKLFDKSVSAVLSAIELYNKPDFKYREEVFTVLLVNGWELLLKAKILKENNNKLKSLYYKKAKKNKKGEKTKKMEYVKNRSQSNSTIDLFACIRELEKIDYKLDLNCFLNIEALTEIRDNSIHFCNSDKLLNKKIQELGTASLKNYVILVKKWFNESLDNFNFYLMPVSFFNDFSEVDGVNISSSNKEIENLTKYLAEKEKANPFSESNEFHLSVKIDLKLVKSDTEGSARFSYSKDKNDPKVYISEEELNKKFPLDYANLLIAIKKKMPNFKTDKLFHKNKKELEENPNLCRTRYLDPNNKKSTKKKFYSYNFTDELINKLKQS